MPIGDDYDDEDLVDVAEEYAGHVGLDCDDEFHSMDGMIGEIAWMDAMANEGNADDVTIK